MKKKLLEIEKLIEEEKSGNTVLNDEQKTKVKSKPNLVKQITEAENTLILYR